MTVIIDLRPETGAGLAAIAAEQGISLNEYVRCLLEEQVSGRRHRTLSPAKRAAAWRESVKGLPRTPPLPDAAISRESIYGTRG
ncbi:MAG: toxin-antitoxin system HicB family antitoxin [Rhodopila sp.]